MVGFNQTEYNFSASADSPPGTKLGTTWINMPLSLVSLENESLVPIEIHSVGSFLDDLVINPDSIPWPLYLEPFNTDLYFNDQQHLEQGYSVFISLNLTKDTVTFCDDKYILFPIDIYTQSEFFGIGPHRFYIYIDFFINNSIFHIHTYASVNVSPGEYMHTYSNQFILLMLILSTTSYQ